MKLLTMTSRLWDSLVNILHLLFMLLDVKHSTKGMHFKNNQESNKQNFLRGQGVGRGSRGKENPLQVE